MSTGVAMPEAVSPTAPQTPGLAHGLADSSAGFPVVAVGASAGGLEASRRLLAAIPEKSGIAFILVPHLDPTHESMMVELLAGHTSMKVLQVEEGMPVEPDHFYVIAPGAYLSVAQGALHLSEPTARHGARLPFDFLLHSLANEYGERAVAVVLSGTGADGSLGLQTVKAEHELVVVQEPAEAAFDGMPRSAIATGMVDLVLPVDQIPAELEKRRRRERASPQALKAVDAVSAAKDWLPDIIDLLRTKTSHDFRLYKRGTLQRRIERRMGLSKIDADHLGQYLDILRANSEELDLLANDLLINVTGFFRDPKVFEQLSEKIVPDLVKRRSPDDALRIWIPGCSSGEEAYSLAILFLEEIAKQRQQLKLQIFASDVDPDAIAAAREGLYPEAIRDHVPAARLARFFTREDHGYRVSAELRAAIIFTVHDVLADPPFSRLDLISCRNLLIYFGPEAQSKVLSVFDYSLRDRGVLLLGSAETVGTAESHFEIISKPDRLYRHVGQGNLNGVGLSMNMGNGMRNPEKPPRKPIPSRQTGIADVCQRLMIETYAPAAVMIDRKYECLYHLGPTARFLHPPTGYATHDLFAMTNEDLHGKLRTAIQTAIKEDARVVLPGGRIVQEGRTQKFSLAVQPVRVGAEDFLLVCFIDEPAREQGASHPIASGAKVEDMELRADLEATRIDLQIALRDLASSQEEQKAIKEEALSVNEEFQSTNEELLTSKEELQSLNEELSALNAQLQETLERQRVTASDLQNVLYSTDVATLFLDKELCIRFFTPATKLLFRVIPSDIGRPLADLNSLALDSSLLQDATKVVRDGAPIEREIEAGSGAWYIRRIMPYRNQTDTISGVVITFADSTERRHAAQIVEAAKKQAELANLAKSRFLAAASHDLRQPLQTLTLLQGILAKTVEGEKAQKLVARAEETVGAMSGMLNTLLDITQIESGVVAAEQVVFPVNDMLARLFDAFSYQARATKIDFRMVPCGASIKSDPNLLEQMLRNLLSNALKYTKRGKVLLGCRRLGRKLSIEVWDTGIGIPSEELKSIFEEYRQLDNPVHDKNRGLGLGLSIVQRLGNLLGHHVHVRSRQGKGSVFATDVLIEPNARSRQTEPTGDKPKTLPDPDARRNGVILLVEDDPEVRELLEMSLKSEGHHTTTAPDAIAALALLAHGMIRPDLILADYNLPNGLTGLQLSAKFRQEIGRDIPVVILTGDISSETLREINRQNCVRLNKPVMLNELTQAIQRLLPVSIVPGAHHRTVNIDDTRLPTLHVVDDDNQICTAIAEIFKEAGWNVATYDTAERFLETYRPVGDGCLLVDAYLPGINGIDLLSRLKQAAHSPPVIMMTGHSDVTMVVKAMKAGAVDFIEKPLGRDELIASAERALEQSRDASKLANWRKSAAGHIAGLTERQLEIMDLVLAGHPSKNIAADLGISQRTVENHRASIMKRTGAKSLPALARLALVAASNGADDGGAKH